uniref:Uncharacterized protein n=1 Tax=Romanomermis culicivorax TaxID=13658 RepID=A0A915K1C3_ROMCU
MFSSKILRCRSAFFYAAAARNFSPSTVNGGFFQNLKAKLTPNYKLTSSISDEKRLNEELLDVGVPRLFQICMNVDYLTKLEKFGFLGMGRFGVIRIRIRGYPPKFLDPAGYGDPNRIRSGSGEPNFLDLDPVIQIFLDPDPNTIYPTFFILGRKLYSYIYAKI